MFLGKVALWVGGDFSVFCRFEKEEGCLGRRRESQSTVQNFC